MKHPKTCNGCRAFWQSLCHYYCALGYKQKVSTVGRFRGAEIHHVAPLGGECPKPLTYNALITAPRA